MSDASPFPSTPSRAEAEAAAWIARLQSDSRFEATGAGLRAWLDTDEANREAFERATEIWEMIPGAALLARTNQRTDTERVEKPARLASVRSESGRGMVLLSACLLLLVSVAVLTWQVAQPQTYSVPAGKQQVAVLEDGTRISLNTGSDLTVDYGERTREVRLERGEALFEVETDPNRPFVVLAGEERIVALGTSFVVRHLAGEVSVTLIEGKVAISDAQEGKHETHEPVVLAPGERWSVSAKLGAGIDAPSLAAATAWKEGKALFDDTTLAEAAAEMNRYGGPRITIADPRLAGLRVSGAFNTAQPVAFAQAVAGLHGLQTERTGGQVMLRRDRSAVLE